MIKELRKIQIYQSSQLILAILVVTIFSAETIVMFILELTSFSLWIENLIDSSFLIVIIFPILYFLVFRPSKLFIAELKKTDEELRKSYKAISASEKRLNDAQRTAHIGSWELDIVNNHLIWSDEIYRIFEIDPKKFGASYESFLDMIHPEDRATVDLAYTNSLKTRIPYAVEHRLLFPDGRVKYVYEQCETSYEIDGKPLRSVGTVQDITGRKLMENMLLQSNRLLNAISHAQFQFITDTHPRVIFEELLGNLLSLTNSEYGFIGEVLYTPGGEPYLKTHAITNISWNEETQAFYEKNAPDGLEFYNLKSLFGAVMTTGKPVISNNPATDPRRCGIPEGHPPLNAFLGLPFYKGKKLVGMVGIANRPGGYDDKLVEYLSPFLATCANIIEAWINNKRRKIAEESLQGSKERYKRLIESVTDYIFTVKVENGRPAATTHGLGCVAITGFTPEEYETDLLLWHKIVLEDDRQVVIDHAESVLSGKTFPLEHRIVRKDGRIRWVRNTPVPHYDEQGNLVSYDGLISDITERKLAEISMKEAKKELEATFDSISDPLLIHDTDFRVVRANNAYLTVSGEAKFEEIIGKPYYEVFPKMECPFKMSKNGMQFQEVEEELKLPAVDEVFKVKSYPIKDADGNYIYSVLIFEDVTEATRVQERIKDEMEVTTHLLMIAKASATTTDSYMLMEEVTHCISKILKYDIYLSYLWHKEAKIFQPCQEFGLSSDMIPVFRTEPMDEKVEFVRKALEGKEPMVIQLRVESSELWVKNKKTNTPNSELQTPNYFPWLPDIKTITVIPLIGKTDYLGLIIGIYKTSKEFAESDKKLMQGISHQVSTALEQANLYTDSINKSMELYHKVETIQIMHEIDRSILSTLKAEEILDTITRLVGKIIPCDMATVVLVDKERQGFIYKAGFGVTIVQKEAFIPFKDSSAEDVVRMRRTEYISDIRKFKGLRPIEETFLKDGFLSHIRIPLIVKGEIDAVLSVGAKRAAAFTPEDLSTLERLSHQIGIAMKNARLVTDLEKLFIGTVKSLSSAIDAKSKWTAGHSERVTKYAIEIGKKYKLSENDLKDLELGGLLHDIGKIGIHEAILDKPDKLTNEEFKLIKQHPVKGAEILASIKQLKDIISTVKHHHEYYNGKGYPDGLKSEEIPLIARIMCVADSVDAMEADRPYRKGITMVEIIAELKKCSGTQFDPKVVEVFLKVIR